MFALKFGMMPVPAGAVRVVMLASVLALAGCASQSSNYHTSANTPPTRVAGYASVAVEDDGLPAQAPPPSRIRDLPDDPSEPYSRNYRGPTGKPVPLPPQQAADHNAGPLIPDDLPPSFRSQLVATVGAIE